MDQHVVTIEFTDGAPRPVYEADDGRQYVISGGGDKVYGLWFVPPEPTVIVNGPAAP